MVRKFENKFLIKEKVEEVLSSFYRSRMSGILKSADLSHVLYASLGDLGVLESLLGIPSHVCSVKRSMFIMEKQDAAEG